MSAAVPAGPAPGGPTTLLVIAKEPLPGRVKTRLTPPYEPAEAALLAEAALTDTLWAVRAMPACRRVLVLDGRPGPWLPPGFEVLPQCAGGLDERLAAAFAACTGPALLVGMDTPQLTPGLLAPALGPAGWQGCDAWFGPAADGGFWALGLAEPWQPGLLRGVPMSTATTGAVQRRRLVAAGLRVRDLPELLDADTAADALHVAAAAPGSRFAAAVDRLGRRTAGPAEGSAAGVPAGARSGPGSGARSGTRSGEVPPAPRQRALQEPALREPAAGARPASAPSPGGGGRPCRPAN